MLRNILILILFVIFLSGCGSKDFNKEVITFSSWGSITETKILKKIILDFEKENPEIKINFVHIPENYFQKLHLLIASNNSPDVVFINNLYLPVYSKYLLDLTDIISKNDFYKQAIEGLCYEKKLYAYPRDISNLLLYVNNDIIKETPQNWSLDDLLNILQKKSGEVYGIGTEEDIYWMQPYLSYYGEIFDEKYSAKDSNAFKFYKDLKFKYKVSPTKSEVGSSTLAQMFLERKLAFYLSGRWMYPKIQQKASFNWSVVSFPQGKGTISCDVSGWAISKNTKHKESALKFAEYLANETSSKYFTQTGLIVPARIETSLLLFNDKHNEKEFLRVLNNSKSIIIPKNYKKIVDKFNRENF